MEELARETWKFRLEVIKTFFTVVGAISIVLAFTKLHQDNVQAYDSYLQHKKDAAIQFLLG